LLLVRQRLLALPALFVIMAFEMMRARAASPPSDQGGFPVLANR
jgi:hypothetical protein